MENFLAVLSMLGYLIFLHPRDSFILYLFGRLSLKIKSNLTAVCKLARGYVFPPVKLGAVTHSNRGRGRKVSWGKGVRAGDALHLSGEFVVAVGT